MADDITRRLRRLVERGITIREAAAAIGISPSRAWVRVDALGDTITRRRRRRVTAAEHSRMVELIDQGLSRGAVGRRLKRSKSVIQHHVAGAPATTGAKRIRSAIRCERCGAKIIVAPCVRCAAVDATRRAG